MIYEHREEVNIIERVSEKAAQKIISAREYNSIEHDAPHIFDITKGARQLVYFGSSHTATDLPEDEVFWERLRTSFSDFVTRQRNMGSNGIVYIEGGVRDTATTSGEPVSEHDLRLRGEMAYTQYLAEQAGIEVYSPEPSEVDIITKVLDPEFQLRMQAEERFPIHYTIDGSDLMAFYLLGLTQYAKSTQKRDVPYSEIGIEALKKEYLLNRVEGASVSWIKDAVSSGDLEEMREWYNRILIPQTKEDAAKLAIEFQQFMHSESGAKAFEVLGKRIAERFLTTIEEIDGVALRDPRATDNNTELVLDVGKVEGWFEFDEDNSWGKRKTQVMNVLFSKIRDEKMVKDLAGSLATGKNVFITFGASHAVMQEPAVREVFESLAH